MSKIFTSTFERCSDCPHRHTEWDEGMDCWTGPYCYGTQDPRLLSRKPFDPIPDWCPLPDYKQAAMKLPPKFMDELLPEARGCRFFGHKLEDLSKEEPMVWGDLLGKQMREAEKRHEHEMKFMSGVVNDEVRCARELDELNQQ